MNCRYATAGPVVFVPRRADPRVRDDIDEMKNVGRVVSSFGKCNRYVDFRVRWRLPKIRLIPLVRKSLSDR